MNMRRILTLAATIGAAISTWAPADILHLKDGSSIEGDVKRGDTGWVVTLADGATVVVPNDSVQSIEAGTKVDQGQGEPQAGLASLRRSTENQTDPRPIIERYKRFIGQFPDTPAAAEAQKDLAVWQERLDKGLVRVGKEWVSPSLRGEMRMQALQLADQARQKIKEGRLQEATPLITQAIAADPTSPTALYLRSLIEYQDNQFVVARKDLETVKAATPNHAPTLNNLAVITARQNRWGEAMSYFEQAMRSQPADRVILDNVAEALHTVQEDPQKNVQRTLLQRVTGLFAAQDPMLQAKMKEQGLQRWGATWVTDADMARLQEAQRQIDQKIASLQSDYDATQQEIQGIDQRIASNNATLRQIESNSFRQDIYGRLISLPLPPLYGQVQADTQNMQTARAQAMAKLDNLRAQAKSIQRQLPIPQYNGTLQVIGADGAPVVLAPTTNPSPGS